jgi:Arc/MetJ-type ribon-helix-helix transcriptional regulator
MSVGFRLTAEDLRVIEANRRQGEKTSDVIRRALRLLDREAWQERARADMYRLRDEDLSAGRMSGSMTPTATSGSPVPT